MDWLNENAQRSYPFIDGSAMDEYPAAIVDAVFSLGQDIPFDFDDDTAEIRLTTVTIDGTGHHLGFQYYAQGLPVGPSLAFTVPPAAPRHLVVRADTSLSHGYLTVGDIATLPAGTPQAPVEARTITPLLGASVVTVSVYNAVRRGSYLPYAPTAPGLTHAQIYNQAKAAAPPWAANVVVAPAEGSLTGGIIGLTPGFNTEVAADPATSTVTVGLTTDGPEAGCSILGYVASKMGTSDPVADLDGDGIVTPADLAIAANKLALTPAEISIQGVLRTVNGVPAKIGNLVLTAGAGIDFVASPETNSIQLAAQSVSLPEKCV